MASLDGNTFVELSIASFASLSSSYLLVSELSNGIEMSFKANAIDIQHQLLREYEASASLKSMAYQNEGDYALSCHDHDIYTSAYWHGNSDVSDIALLRIDDYTNDQHWCISAKNQFDGSSGFDDSQLTSSIIRQLLLDTQPYVGEMHFIASQPCIDIKNAAFTGWLPINSAIDYELTSFVLSNAIQTVFDIESTTFNLSQKFNTVHNSFVKFFHDLDAIPNTKTLCQSCLPAHSHNVTKDTTAIKTAIDLDLNDNDPNVRFGIKGTNDSKRVHVPTFTNQANFGNGAHCGDDTPSYLQTFLVECTISSLASNTFNNGTMTTCSSGTPNEEHYPSHMTLPAYVYVGYSIYSKPMGISLV